MDFHDQECNPKCSDMPMQVVQGVKTCHKATFRGIGEKADVVSCIGLPCTAFDGTCLGLPVLAKWRGRVDKRFSQGWVVSGWWVGDLVIHHLSIRYVGQSREDSIGLLQPYWGKGESSEATAPNLC